LADAPIEPAVRLGPAVANLLKVVWRQRVLVVVGLVLGLALGLFALPRMLGSTSKYQAAVRMQVLQSPTDAIFKIAPQFGGGGEQQGVSTDVLKDISVAESVVKQLRPRSAGLTGTTLLTQLNFEPVVGTPLVDVSFQDPDPAFATDVVVRYTNLFVDKRNKAEADRMDQAIRSLQDLANGLPAASRKTVQTQIDAARQQQAVTGPPTTVDGSPIVTQSGPPLSRKVTVGLGLLLGLAIGAGAGLLVETAFRKVTSEADAEEASDLPFIAAVRKNGVRRTSIPVIERPFSPAAEDYRRVATALERQGLGGDIRVLAIFSADPDEGKSMLAANLAHSLARQGRDVIVVSSDLRRPKVEQLLGLRRGAGLAEALQQDSTNVIGLLVSINEHLLVLPAGQPTKHPGELLSSKRLVEIVGALRKVGIVILDSPPARLSADAMTLASVADASLLVARSGVSRMRSVFEATSGLRRDRLRQLGVVLVGTSSPWLRSLWMRSYRERGESGAEEAPGRSGAPVRLAPRDGQDAANVTELNAALERDRRAAD
jgi:capsular exopolysaccharide synthesis family protein